MRSVKLMLSGIMLMLTAFCGLILDNRSNSWLAGVAVLLMPLSLILFVAGLFTKTKPE